MSKYKENSKRFNWKNITFPVKVEDIYKFEKQNDSIAINVFYITETVYFYNDNGHPFCSKNEVQPIRIKKDKWDKTVVNLLLISDGETQHYCWIKNMSKLLSSQLSKNSHQRYYCYNCLNSFNTQNTLDKHTDLCYHNESVKTEFPKEKNLFVTFKYQERSMNVPFVIYADFECFTEEISTCQPNPQNSYTIEYQKHTPSGFCYYVKCFDDHLYKQNPVLYTKKSEDDDVAQKFVDSIEKTIKDIYQKFKFPKKINMTDKDKENFKQAQICHICDKLLGEDKVRDHCHLTGKFRGAAHNTCNLKYKVPKFIPVIFHNLSGYDCHLFIKNLGVSEGSISCIPNNEEKYISFTKRLWLIPL